VAMATQPFFLIMRRFTLTFIFIIWSFCCPAADDGVCTVANNRAKFDHQNVVLAGRISALKETISQAHNAYTTFKLEDGNCSLDIFLWGHPILASGEKVKVEGVFEVEHHQGKYTFYNEVQATTVGPK
jgi:hypothetical protein